MNRWPPCGQKASRGQPRAEHRVEDAQKPRNPVTVRRIELEDVALAAQPAVRVEQFRFVVREKRLAGRK